MDVENMRDKVSKEHTYMKKQEPILQETIHNTSPAHEFSFTISFNPHPPPKPTQHDHKHNTYINNNNNNHRCLTPLPQQPLTAVDLSPADDIFFRGHLLPLHPLSPRSSTNSMDSFTLPMKDIINDQNNPTGNTSFHYHHHHHHGHQNTFSDFNIPRNNIVIQTRPKSKSFSIFSIPKWKKQSPDHEGNNNNNSMKNFKIEVGQLIKRYMNMVKPFMSFPKTNRSNKSNNNEYKRQPHSFSGNFLNRGGVRRGRFSAPASIRTSPANSGILVGSGTLSPAKSITSDSTMEELQAAIQAAIAHCKNSIAIDHQDKGQV